MTGARGTGRSAVGVMSRPGLPFEAGLRVRSGSGVGSSVVRAAIVVVLLNFDQFPRLIARGFVVTAVLLAVPLILHEFLRPVSRARVVVFWVLVLFGVLALPGVARAPESEYGQQKFFLLVTLTMAAALAVAVLRGPRDVEMFAVVFVVSGLVLAVAALTGDSEGGRASGFGSNPIWLARAVGAALVALTWLYLRRRLSAWPAALLAVILLLGLIATGSRGPLLAAVVAMFFLVLAGLRLKIRQVRREWVGLTLMGALVLVVAALPSLLPPRVYALVVDPSEELFGSARAAMREATMPIIAENPGGIGYGNWGDYSGMAVYRYPHNLWLELPAEAGWLVGGSLVLAVLAVAFGLWLVSRREPAAGLVLGLLAFYAVAVSTSGDINGDRPLFVVLALGVLVLAGARARAAGGRLGESRRRARAPAWGTMSPVRQASEGGRREHTRRARALG
ncbi:O-antigen ligase family protein [Micromonospora tulbaghiae]|uniref:O-antigen ligase family protein n=1 Tax=Micromonospora tulbaghiae TaxID=479978 RepID=UPI0033FF3ECE